MEDVNSEAETVRVAVVLDSTIVPAWVHSVLSGLDRHASLDWDLALVTRGLLRAPARAIGFRAFAAVDARRHLARVDDASTERDAAALVNEHHVIELDDDRDLASAALPARAEREVGHTFDVVLDLRAVPRSPGPTELAHLGVWRTGPVHDAQDGDDAVFWAIHDRRFTCDVRVVASIAERPEPVTIAAATVGLQPASVAVSRNLCLWKAAALLLHALADPGSRGRLDRKRVEGNSIDRNDSPGPSRPGFNAVLRVSGRQLSTSIRKRNAARRSREQWLLGVRVRTTDTHSLDGNGFRQLSPPADRAYADPFLLEDEAKTYLFLEEIEFARGRGVISVTTLSDDGTAGAPEVVLERPYHLSYPFVFRDGADIFMIPETAANRTVELYRAADFPRRWELHDLLLEDVRALDSSLFWDGERYWLFTSIEEPGRNRNDELHLFTSAGLSGPWLPHPRNPVVSDVRRARPAGRPFVMDGSLIRPAQDCSRRYGASIAFQRVDVLSEDEYSESTVAVLDPTWARGLDATHTFNSAGRLDVVDGLRRIPR